MNTLSLLAAIDTGLLIGIFFGLLIVIATKH